ncbi:MAG: hypothetical protein K2N01_09300 [Lachnospiraceae bacterium]|nr:hypothetical protein [Lachnospiraceae bacterium]
MKQDFKTVMHCILLLFGIVICMLVCDSDRIREEDYINRIYVVDQGDTCGYEFSIYITELDDEHMEGYGNRHRKAQLLPRGYSMEGYRDNGRMSGSFRMGYPEGNVTFTLDFLPDSRVQVTIPATEEQYLLRPYRLEDNPDESVYEELSGEIELETWGKVQLINIMSNTRHPIAGAYLANEKGEIMYDFYPQFMNGLDIVECTVIDMNGDGLKDIEWILALGDDAHFRYREYQRTDGTFGDGDVLWLEKQGLVYEAK